jgi:hypothetical protein
MSSPLSMPILWAAISLTTEQCMEFVSDFTGQMCTPVSRISSIPALLVCYEMVEPEPHLSCSVPFHCRHHLCVFMPMHGFLAKQRHLTDSLV